jgi:hypothetical protein
MKSAASFDHLAGCARGDMLSSIRRVGRARETSRTRRSIGLPYFYADRYWVDHWGRYVSAVSGWVMFITTYSTNDRLC